MLRPPAVLVTLVILVLSAAFLFAETLPPANAPRAGGLTGGLAGGREAKEDRLREGMKISQVEGRFELVGERATFVRSDGKEPLRVLENLALERVVQTLQDERSRYQWVVSGTITEFRSANYLLITRAVISGRGGGGAP